jgi:hypothetical protein
MQEKPWRRVTVTSSLNEISKDQPRVRVVLRGRDYSAHPHPNLQQASRHKFKDNVNGFSTSSDFYFAPCLEYPIYVL